MTEQFERIKMALGAMAAGPRHLRAYLQKPGPDIEAATGEQVDDLLALLISPDPNSPARLLFSGLLRSWDNAKGAQWAGDTARNSAGRRERIHELLKSEKGFREKVDQTIPFYYLDEPLIVAKEHRDWYEPQPGIRDYYWQTYLKYLKERREWSDASLLNMDNSTRAIVECLANPESSKAYASRGLVMGYVQSGKTANFTGVVARAADAGYRLIIVLAGTWNILRNQTQRRFDKELLGKELLVNDEAYSQHPPSDWPEFLEHGVDPVTLGHFSWQRLTRPDIDFKSLNAAIDNLEFERRNKARPLYDPTNLHALPVKLLVVKKNSRILFNLVKDLKLLAKAGRTHLADLPTLIIDDESDQAGLNTADPDKVAKGEEARPKINAVIVELLGLFPRGQYVGYTATPYANALVNPDDPQDLFPKDFIVSLERPTGYMGVSDFFDPDTEYSDLDPTDFSQPEIALIRRVESAAGADDEDLKKALRSYVLSGAVKLYRHARDPKRYKSEHCKHHTMLVHTTQRTGEQTTLGARLKDLWDQCAFNTARGLRDLEKLWADDFAKVCAAVGSEIAPKSVNELIPHLSEAIKRIESGPKIFLVVNSDTPEAPDFSSGAVWKVIVGGNKLSRGYTVEGLTVSFYRRVARNADTLMQMGRWFGFRPGYRDLVRVFLGVKEGKRGDTDLVSLFKEVCRMEERFREELKRYVRRPNARRITPKDIPPLISISGSLPPTARNKMFNAVVKNKNFGGQRSMLTLAAANSTRENIAATCQLLTCSQSPGTFVLGGNTKEKTRIESTSVVFKTTNAAIIEFLKAYRWLETDFRHPERPKDANLQLEFLEQQDHGIQGWLVIAPQRQKSFGRPLKIKGFPELSVKERHRVNGRGFQVYGEPAHRSIAEFIAGIRPGVTSLSSPNAATKKLAAPNQAVMLLYPVRESEAGKVSIGFELMFPENSLPFDLNFTVESKKDRDSIVI